jgi:hypothetical protein
VANSDSEATKEKTKELQDKLANVDMDLFDRYMDWLVNVPKEQIDKAAKQIKRG